MEWILQEEGWDVCRHYVDDFFLVAGHPAVNALGTLDRVCGLLGVPMAAHKQESPTTCPNILRTELDSKERI